MAYMGLYRYPGGGWGAGLGLHWEGGVPVEDVPAPTEQTFPAQTPPIVEPSQPTYSLPVEVFHTIEKALPIFVSRPEPVYSDIPTTLQSCVPRDYVGPLPAGAVYCSGPSDIGELGWAGLLLAGLTTFMLLGSRKARRRVSR